MWMHLAAIIFGHLRSLGRWAKSKGAQPWILAASIIRLVIDVAWKVISLLLEAAG